LFILCGFLKVIRGAPQVPFFCGSLGTPHADNVWPFRLMSCAPSLFFWMPPPLFIVVIMGVLWSASLALLFCLLLFSVPLRRA
jgi:hypothetical protein